VKENDKLRQQQLERDELQVIRFTNTEILSNLQAVIQAIEQLIHNWSAQKQ
jgi:very-short-patch-repair endonuclease